jgi:hypothetical protein
MPGVDTTRVKDRHMGQPRKTTSTINTPRALKAMEMKKCPKSETNEHRPDTAGHTLLLPPRDGRRGRRPALGWTRLRELGVREQGASVHGWRRRRNGSAADDSRVLHRRQRRVRTRAVRIVRRRQRRSVRREGETAAATAGAVQDRLQDGSLRGHGRLDRGARACAGERRVRVCGRRQRCGCGCGCRSGR